MKLPDIKRLSGNWCPLEDYLKVQLGAQLLAFLSLAHRGERLIFCKRPHRSMDKPILGEGF